MNTDSENSDDYNSRIENIAQQITQDQTSPSEQDPKILSKYYDYAKTSFNLNDEQATTLVHEAFLYLQLKNSSDVDLIKEGDKFGAGFS